MVTLLPERFRAGMRRPSQRPLMQVPHQDLLVVERKVIDDVVFQCGLGAAEHAGILQSELLEHHRGDLVFDALAHTAGRMEKV